MKIHIDMLFYAIRNRFPKAVLIEGDDVHSIQVEGLMFWSSAERMRGHLVVIEHMNGIHFVRLYSKTVFVMAGAPSGDAMPFGNSCIALGEELPLGQTVNRLIEIFDRFAAWKADLDRAADEFLSYDSIIRSCDAMLRAPLALMDGEFHYVSCSKRLAAESGYEELFVDENGYLPLEYVNIATSDPSYRGSLKERGVFQLSDLENGLHKNVFYDGECIGRLTLPSSRDAVENAYSAQVITVVAGYVERLYSKLGTFYRFRANETRLRGAICEILEGQQVDSSRLGKLLENRGFQQGDRYYLVQFRSNADTAAMRLGESLGSYLSASWPGCLGFAFDGKTLMLANATFFARSARRAFMRAMAYFLRESLLVAGLSRAFNDVLEVRVALRQTDIALACGENLDPTQWFPKFDDYAFWYLCHFGSQEFLPHQVCDLAIGVLIAYDQANSTDLSLTLRTYIAQRYNAVATAKALCISRSAFLKRLARIETLTNVNLDDFERRVYLALSYAIYDQER